MGSISDDLRVLEPTPNCRENATQYPEASKNETPGSVADEISFNWGSMPGNISTVMLPRAVLEAVGPFDTEMKLAADFEMWVRIQSEYPVGFCNMVSILRRAAGPPSVRLVTYDDRERAEHRVETLSRELQSLAESPEYDATAIDMKVLEEFSARSMAGRLAKVMDEAVEE